MINLLPDEDKKQIRAARTNVILFRYNLLSLGAIVFLVAAIIIANLYLVSTNQLAEDAIKDNTLREGSYAEIKTQADQLRSELANSKTILDGQISYAKAALAISELLPTGTTLNELTLNEKSFGTPMILTVNIADEKAAAALISNFTNSKIFTNVTKGKISVGTGNYPYALEITVTMNKEAAL